MVSMCDILRKALESIAPEIKKGKPLSKENKSLDEQLAFVNLAEPAVLLMENNVKVHRKAVASTLETCESQL